MINRGELKKYVKFQGSSMLPTIKKGDEIFVREADPSAIRIGDIIMYECGQPDMRYIVHRVVHIKEKAGGRYFYLKGDHFLFSLGFPIEEVGAGQYRGRVEAIIRGGKFYTINGTVLSAMRTLRGISFFHGEIILRSIRQYFINALRRFFPRTS